MTKKAQEGILEFHLVNHPLDCPVCDKGGECPLQDQALAYGPGESRFIEEKRHFEKPIMISPLVYLDRERCILCDRCTRFAKEVAGDPLIHFQGRGNQTQVNTFPDDPFASYFSGNVVQICPVGALTAVPYRFKARPWDLEEVESTATVDSLGARIAVQSSRNRVLRIVGVDADAVNWGWLSDKERFSYEAFDSEARLTEPLLRGNALGQVDSNGDQLVRATWAQALGVAAGALTDAGPSRVGVLGGARLTNEAAYVWAKLVKGVLGTDNVDCQLGDGLPADVVLGLPRATIADACTPGGVVVLIGPDPKEELGTLFLRLRHAVVEDRATLIELTPRSTGLSKLTTHHLHGAPGTVGDLAHALVDPVAPVEAVAGVSTATIDKARAVIRSGRPVTVVLGRASLAESPAAVIDAALAFRDAVPGVKFLSALRRGNVHGALDMGLAPGLLPGRTTLAASRADFIETWPNVPAAAGLDATGILEAAAAGRINTLVLLGADPLRDFPDRALAQKALEAVETLIAVDLFVTQSAALADVVLAAAGPTEVEGSFTNVEGRVSALRQKVTPPGTARSDWMIAADLAFRLGHDLGVESVDDIRAEIAERSPIHAPIVTDAIDGTEGVLIEGGAITAAARERSPRPAPGELRLVVTRSMYDLGTILQNSPSSADLAPGTTVRLHPGDFASLDLAAGAPVTVSSAKGSVRSVAHPDPGVPRGAAAMLFNQPDADVSVLLDARAATIDVRVARA